MNSHYFVRKMVSWAYSFDWTSCSVHGWWKDSILVFEKPFLRTKIHHFHEMKTMENEKTRNLALCMVLTCCQLDKMWGKFRLYNLFFHLDWANWILYFNLIPSTCIAKTMKLPWFIVIRVNGILIPCKLIETCQILLY